MISFLKNPVNWIVFFILLFISFRCLKSANYVPTHNAVRYESHVGCVLFRRSADPSVFEYLLLHSAHGAYRWVIPKGQYQSDFVETNKTLEQELFIRLAVNLRIPQAEVKLIPGFLAGTHFVVGYTEKNCTYFLGELLRPTRIIKIPKSKFRTYAWYTLKDACLYVKFPKLRNILKSADSFLKSLNNTS